MNGSSSAAFIALADETIARLIGLRHGEDETLAEVVDRLSKSQMHGRSTQTLEDPPRLCPESGPLPPKARRSPTGRYRLTILGDTVIAGTLGEVLATALRTLADLDVGILYRLEKMGGRTRRHVARSRDAIYPGHPDLNADRTIEFLPGWWVGTNYSRSCACRILADACQAAGLDYGTDLELIAI